MDQLIIKLQLIETTYHLDQNQCHQKSARHNRRLLPHLVDLLLEAYKEPQHQQDEQQMVLLNQ